MPKTKYTLLRLPKPFNFCQICSHLPPNQIGLRPPIWTEWKNISYLAEIYGKTNAFLFYNANMSFAPSASLIAS